MGLRNSTCKIQLWTLEKQSSHKKASPNSSKAINSTVYKNQLYKCLKKYMRSFSSSPIILSHLISNLRALL